MGMVRIDAAGWELGTEFRITPLSVPADRMICEHRMDGETTRSVTFGLCQMNVQPPQGRVFVAMVGQCPACLRVYFAPIHTPADVAH